MAIREDEPDIPLTPDEAIKSWQLQADNQQAAWEAWEAELRAVPSSRIAHYRRRERADRAVWRAPRNDEERAWEIWEGDQRAYRRRRLRQYRDQLWTELQKRRQKKIQSD